MNSDSSVHHIGGHNTGMLCNAAQERKMGRQKQQLQAAAEHEAQLAAAALAAVEAARVSTAPKAVAIFKAHIRSTECLYPMPVSLCLGTACLHPAKLARSQRQRIRGEVGRRPLIEWVIA